jgi:hypothetical protein
MNPVFRSLSAFANCLAARRVARRKMSALSLLAFSLLAIDAGFAQQQRRTDVTDSVTVGSMPCFKYLIAYGTPQLSAVNDQLIDFVMSQGDGLGSSANMADYVATECRLNEGITVGQALKNLFDQRRKNRLPPIPIGGATSDPEAQASWKAFERWIHHQGPRPVFVDNSPAEPSQTKQSLSHTPIEEKAIVDDTMKGKFEAIDALAILVKVNTFKCESISAVRTWLFSRGYTLICNNYNYEYEIADKGGHWIVTVK